MRKVHDQAYKTEICKRIAEGGSTVSFVSKEIGIRDTTIYGWVSRYRENS
ncbi:transposase [Pseudobacteroides cellulosolvens]|uniref:Transposase IS3/IS911 n=1 Tax=Pseudobacteroides cellulosolvens ATCC 35603 = DSM 2933 TaxID=398512 RepID=A0A0L6JSP4_9FIRM|nr:transposase [Pseudobacteroides cellulosolvens]KNY28866.1 transposase IS3/IS911 [Pseudobacteroides cellulosolvens ATCC 35603 = DSM 2933]